MSDGMLGILLSRTQVVLTRPYIRVRVGLRYVLPRANFQSAAGLVGSTGSVSNGKALVSSYIFVPARTQDVLGIT
jgi:hypothetical protein